MSISIQQMADRIAELLEARLRIKGAGLSAKLKRGGRHLPKRVHAAAEALAEAERQSGIPHLQARVDRETTAQAYDICVRYLKPLGAGARRKAFLWGLAGSVMAVVLLTGAMAVSLLLWRGYL